MVATKLEGQAVAALVFNALAADAGAGGVSTLLGGRIYRDQVPQGAQLPAATVSLVSSTPTNTRGGVRVLERSLIDVHLITSGAAYDPINPAAKRADVIVQGLAGQDSGVNAVKLVKEQTTAYPEDDAGRSYRHIVQTYATPAYST